MDYKMILCEKEENISVITLNRPEKRNAVNVEMRDEIIHALEDVGRDHEIRVVIITGGKDVFCAGADIKAPPTPSLFWDKISPKRTYSYYHLIEDMGKPVIAAIAGYCLGGGLELACTCDIRIASENALLGDAHSKLGVIGGGGSTQRLPRIIGLAKAKELIFSGETIGAREAERIGLVNKVVPSEALMDEAKKLANLYKERPPIVLKLAKYAIDGGFQMSLAQGLDYEAKCATLVSLTEDCKEGVEAFKEKRKPRFQGK
ncbi:MAG: enoyl-CoA hydratase/isomerase family protein [Pseudomonadota bacterium]